MTRIATARAMSSQIARPPTITAAVALTVVIALATAPVLFLPGSDEIPAAGIAIGIVGALLSLVGAWGLWRLYRWGAVLTFVVTLLNTLSSLPVFFDPPSAWVVAANIILIPIQIAVLVLIALPASRRAYA
jgi:hypothetical protein